MPSLKKVTITSVNPMSIAKVAAWVAVIGWLLLLVPVTLITLAVGDNGWEFVLGYIFFGVCTFIGTGIGAMIAAYVYNLVASRFGGVEVMLEEKSAKR